MTLSMVERRGGEAGSGLVGASAGIVLVVTVLLALVQVSLNLATTGALTAAGYAAARTVASAAVDHHDDASVASAMGRAERALRASIGPAAATNELHWELGSQTVHLTVTADVARVVPRAAIRPLGLDHVRRTFVVRIEGVR